MYGYYFSKCCIIQAWLKKYYIQRKIKNFYVEIVIFNIISHYSVIADFFIHKIVHEINKTSFEANIKFK